MPRQERSNYIVVYEDEIAKHGHIGALVLALIDRRSNKEGYCYAGIRSLAKSLSLSVNTVMKHIDKLVEAGELEVVKESDGVHARHMRLVSQNEDASVSEVRHPSVSKVRHSSVSEVRHKKQSSLRNKPTKKPNNNVVVDRESWVRFAKASNAENIDAWINAMQKKGVELPVQYQSEADRIDRFRNMEL